MDARTRVEIEILKINRQLEASASTSTVKLQCVADTVNPHTFFSIIPHDVTRNIIRPMLFTPAPNTSTRPGFTTNELMAFMTNIATDVAGREICKNFGYSPETILFQAVIDDHRDLVKTILNKNPSLLLALRQDEMIVQSQYTWQTFKISPNESPLAIAAKRHQLEMIKLLLPYYEQLIQDGRLSEESRQYASAAREAGLNAWSFYTMTKNADNQDEIVIPPEYSSVINNLIDVFRNDTTLVARQTDFTKLSKNTENAMLSFLDWLVPEGAVELEKHIDVELLLLAAYRLYDQRFNAFTSWEQRNAFCIRVIGLIQSALSPETAKIFCQGLYDVVERKRPISDQAASLKLYGGEYFYRAERVSLAALGGKYLCAGGGVCGRHATLRGVGWPALFVENLCRTKTSSWAELMQRHYPEPRPEPSTGCVIC